MSKVVGHRKRNAKVISAALPFDEDGEIMDTPVETVTYLNKRYENIDNMWEHNGGMPHFDPRSTEDYHAVELIVEDQEALDKLIKATGALITEKTRCSWYPHVPPVSGKMYIQDPDVPVKNPQFPIYIVSKSRWETRLTSDALVKMKVPHYIVVEKSQIEEYRSRVNPEFVTILELEQRFLDEYETCDDLGATRSKGPGAARNFAWDHSIRNGYKWHWVMDDNARGFRRIDRNKRYRVYTGSVLRAVEDHVQRYENVGISGCNYNFFAIPQTHLTPMVVNTRIYSCLLIRNDIPFRWRGRYNEDTILSLDALKAGWCTIQYNTCLFEKIATQALKGGNTEAFYAAEGTKPKSEMLERVHPDVAKAVWKFGRWHHEVNYNPFKPLRLKLKPEFQNIPVDLVDNYGMILVDNTEVIEDDDE